MEVPLKIGAFGFQKQDIRVYYCDGYNPRMYGYHMHTYYEISLLLTGNMSVLLSDNHADRNPDVRAVLLRPYVPHYIVPADGQYYRHCNVEFSADLLSGEPEEYRNLLNLFGSNGSVIQICEEDCKELLQIADKIMQEKNTMKRKLLLLYLLSILQENSAVHTEQDPVPEYIMSTLRYIAEHYNAKILAADLAKNAGVCRTTLMINFKKFTGVTINDYLQQCRIDRAIPMLASGISQEKVAADCGFGTAANLIRVFKSVCGTTPRKYILTHNV